MTNSLSITDGTTTISLSGSGCILTGYSPSAPQYDADGNAPSVTETIQILITESSVAAVQAKVNSINRLLRNARRARKGERDRAYLQLQTGADVASWRSEIVSGRLELGADAWTNLYQQQLDAALIVTRVPYWEGAEAEIELSAKSFVGVGVTGGVTVKNYDSSVSYGNWVQIESDQIGGDLPAAVRLQLANATGSSRTWSVYAAVNSQSDPDGFTHVIEAEDRLSGGTVTADAAASDGNKLDFTISDSTQSFSFTLSATFLQDTQGRPFRVLLSVLAASGSPVGTVRMELRHPSTSATMWVGDDVPMLDGAGIVDLGVLPLPPGRYSDAYGALRLVLVFEGTGTWSLDYLQLMPTDALTKLESIVAVANGATVVANSVEDRAYLIASGAEYPYIVQSGGRLYLDPGVQQRILFMATSSEAGPAIADTMTVRVWAAPRRSSI